MILCGFSGVGKSTVGKMLSQKLDLEFLETDYLLEKKFGMSCPELWKKFGETRFRDLEADVIHSIPRQDNLIVSVGGGALLRESNREHLMHFARKIYLQANVEILYKRLISRRFPVFMEIHQLSLIASRRFPIYESFCNQTVFTDNLKPEEIVKQLAG